jgi:hypothetical protein
MNNDAIDQILEAEAEAVEAYREFAAELEAMAERRSN